MRKVSILLADDNSAVLEHVTKVLEEDYDIVATVKNGASVLSESPLLKPDIIVLDISMGELSGIDVARRLRDSGCNSKIIFLTVHEDADFVCAAMGVGCLSLRREIEAQRGLGLSYSRDTRWQALYVA